MILYGTPTIRRALYAIVLTLGLLTQATALAQNWPAKPVTIVVPFPPGSGLDLLARVIAEKISARTSQPSLVENRPGVGGLAGANFVARSAPDGHVLLAVPNTIVIAPHLLGRGIAGGVDVMKDLAPVILAASTPMVLVVNPSLGVRSVEELLALARKQPGLPYASAGNGTPMHIAGELFKKAASVDMLHVPYKGTGPSVADTLGGQVKVLFVGAGGVAQYLRSGKLLAIAVTEKRRSPLFPDLATFSELGITGADVDTWFGLLAPAGTPSATIARINAEINSAIALPDVRERLKTAGVDARGGTSEAFSLEMREDHARYGRIVREFGIKAD